MARFLNGRIFEYETGTLTFYYKFQCVCVLVSVSSCKRISYEYTCMYHMCIYVLMYVHIYVDITWAFKLYFRSARIIFNLYNFNNIWNFAYQDLRSSGYQIVKPRTFRRAAHVKPCFGLYGFQCSIDPAPACQPENEFNLRMVRNKIWK
jgi:hypothetical protein